MTANQIGHLTRLGALLLVALLPTAPARAVQLHPGDLVVSATIDPNGGPFNPNANTGLLVVDPATGNRTILSDKTHGTGPAFPREIRNIAFQDDGSLLVTMDNGAAQLQALYRVDPVTGDRTLISSAAGSTGPASTYYDAIPFGDRILMVGQPIISVDPATGTRTMVSGPGVGSGPSFHGYSLVASGDDLYVADASGVILKVNPMTGDRTVLSSANVGTGPDFYYPGQIALDNSGYLLVPSLQGQTILRVDPVTGDRTIFTGSGIGTGFGWWVSSQMAVAADGAVFIASIVDLASPQPILRVDPITGNRTIVSWSSNSIGAGPAFAPTGGLAIVPGVPEPSTFVLAAIGLAALCVCRRMTAR